MRRFAALVLLLVVAGCAEGGGLPPLPSEQIRVGFPPHGIADTIQIDAVDRLALRSAELVAPDGSAIPAAAIDVNPAPGFTTSQRLGNDPFAGDVFGVGNVGGAPPLPVTVGGGGQTRAQLLAMVSTALIPLPDPVEYRRNWGKYRIRLVFGTPPEAAETHEIAAPEPPPE
jgi:hypothetical protein